MGLDQEFLTPLIMQITTPVMRSAKCLIHRRMCRYQKGRAHLAGIPCVAWSPQGSRGLDEHTSFLSFASWCGQRRLIREDIVVVECSHLYKPEIIIDLLGDLYEVEHTLLCPTSFGCIARRNRFWGVLILKDWAGLGWAGLNVECVG